MTFKAIVIGTSAGGIEALKLVLGNIKKPINIPIIIVQHLSPKYESFLPEIIGHISGIRTKEVEEKEVLQGNTIYIAPPNYHVLIEKDFTLSLTTGERVSYARPSIDVLFETAADAYRTELIGVLLTGANHDGANGMLTIQHFGGYTIVQSPESSYAMEMPTSALELIKPNAVLDIHLIANKINTLLRNDEV